MGMTIQTEGLTEVSAILTALGDKAQDVASAALFDGAGVVADAFSAGINSIRTAPFKWAKPGEKRLPSPEEKAIIAGHSGIAKFRKTGSEVDTLVGIEDGFESVNWNHMSSKAHTNYKADSGSASGFKSSSKKYLRWNAAEERTVYDRAHFIKAEGRQSSAKPVKMIARAINTGTSYMDKQPFARKAASQSQGAAKAAVIAKAEEKFNEIING